MVEYLLWHNVKRLLRVRICHFVIYRRTISEFARTIAGGVKGHRQHLRQDWRVHASAQRAGARGGPLHGQGWQAAGV